MPIPIILGMAGAALAKKGLQMAAKKVGTAIGKKAVKRVAIGAGVLGAGAAANKAYAASKNSGMPAFSTMPMAKVNGVPLPVKTSQKLGGTPTSPGGLPVPLWKGAGGKLQLPWQDPRIPEYVKQFALDDAFLRVAVRAPRGYVVVRDPEGRPYAVNKKFAKQMGIWKEPAKPPISATEWKHFQSAHRIEKKLLKIARPAIRRHQQKAVVKTTARRK